MIAKNYPDPPLRVYATAKTATSKYSGARSNDIPARWWIHDVSDLWESNHFHTFAKNLTVVPNPWNDPKGVGLIEEATLVPTR